MERLAVTGAVVPELATDEVIEHPGSVPVPVSTTLHCSATVPVKAALGVIVMVEVPVDPAATLTAVPVNVKTPKGTSTCWYVMVSEAPSEAPVTVTK